MPRRATLAKTVADALADVDLQPKDQPAARLALEYADRIDDGDELTRIGPALLATLESLGMTPRARAALTGKGASANVSSPSSPLDQLRARRSARVDAATS